MPNGIWYYYRPLKLIRFMSTSLLIAKIRTDIEWLITNKNMLKSNQFNTIDINNNSCLPMISVVIQTHRSEQSEIWEMRTVLFFTLILLIVCTSCNANCSTWSDRMKKYGSKFIIWNWILKEVWLNWISFE